MTNHKVKTAHCIMNTNIQQWKLRHTGNQMNFADNNSIFLGSESSQNCILPFLPWSKTKKLAYKTFFWDTLQASNIFFSPNVFGSILIQGVPKKVSVKPIFEFETLGGVFLGVKNNSKNFGNKKNIRLLSKILSKLTLFISKTHKFWCFMEGIMFIEYSIAHKKVVEIEYSRLSTQ